MPRRLSHNSSDPIVPVQTSPDSLLLRSTFSALEHSATTLKRLSKSVLACTSAYLNALEQLQHAENEVLASLGELGRWLEGGYGLHESAIWDDNGFKKLRQQARRKEKEELEVMVEHGLKAVRSELKRNGLAGGSAQARFDVSSSCTLLMEGQCQALLQSDIGIPCSSTHKLCNGCGGFEFVATFGGTPRDRPSGSRRRL